jgi:phage tail sheath gpL-like
LRSTWAASDSRSASTKATRDRDRDAIAAAINAAADLPITAAQLSASSRWTFRHKGLVGNSYDVRHSFNFGEALPAGVTLVAVATTAGTTNPVLTALIAAMSDLWFQVIAHPYTDATSLTALEAELASRNGPLRSMDGQAITSMTGNFSAHTSLGGGRNSQFSEIWAQPTSSVLTPPMEFAAETAAILAAAVAADPARPLQTLTYNRAIAGNETDQWDASERNLFLYDGISTTKRTPSGGVAMERAITTYQVSASNADDTSYLDATTLFTLMYLRYSFRQRMQTRYPRHKLASDTVQYGAGQLVMTPKLGKAEAVGWFRRHAGARARRERRAVHPRSRRRAERPGPEPPGLPPAARPHQPADGRRRPGAVPAVRRPDIRELAELVAPERMSPGALGVRGPRPWRTNNDAPA